MKRKTEKRKSYTKGELNKLIDSICHPLWKQNEGFILVDGFLHAMVEQDPPETVRKFIKYNLPKLIEETSKKRKE